MVLQIAKESYFNWIKENSMFTEVLNNSIELSSPFVDSLNENIKLYIIPTDSGFRVSDDGYTLWSLEAMGMSFKKNSRRYKMLQNTKYRFNVEFNEESKEFFINSTSQNLGKSIHLLIQTCLSVSDMLHFDTNTVKSLFNEEVDTYFNKYPNKFSPFRDFELMGKSKLTHNFDYLMTISSNTQKLVRLINHLDQVQLERTIYSWQDTTQQRKSRYNEHLSMVALVNDKEKDIPEKYSEAFHEYEIEVIGFSDKPKLDASLSKIS